MSHFQIALFDLEGTLYSAPPENRKAVRDAMVKCLSRMLGMSEEKVKNKEERLRRKYRVDSTRRAFEADGYEIDWKALYMETCHRLDLTAYLSRLQPDPRLAQVLAQIPLRRVVCTNTPRGFAEQVLRTIGVLDLFERIFGVEDLEHLKPHEESYLHVLHQLDVRPVEVVTFDDNVENLKTAKGLGLLTIYIKKLGVADEIISNVYAASAALTRLEEQYWLP